MPNFYATSGKSTVVSRRFVVASVGGTYKGSETLKARRLAKGIANRGVCLSCLHFHAVSGHFGARGLNLADVLLAVSTGRSTEALQGSRNRPVKAMRADIRS